MKLPFTINLGAVTGVFARLKPSGLLAKLPGKLGGKKKSAQGSDDGARDEDDDMFADLGDLDQLDADAKVRQRGEGARGDEDYTSDAYATDKEVDLDDVTSAGDDAGEDRVPQFADLDGDEGDGIDLSTLEALPDFEDDFTDEDDEEAATAATKKKLLLIAGGGIAAAVLIGAASWLVLSGDGAQAPDATEPANLGANHDMVMSLDNIPMASEPMPAAPVPEPSAGQDASLGEGPAGLNGQDPANAAGGDVLAQLGLGVAQEPGVGVVVPSVTKASFAGVPSAPAGSPLAIAPLSALVEQTDVGILPKIGADGQTPFVAYARPAPPMDAAKPKVAIIVTGLGLSRAATEVAIAAMPENVTLALDIYARGLDFWVARAREDGHEVLLSLPLEASDFPFSDPGPEALRTLSAPEEIVQKLNYILSRTAGYYGVLADHGGKFLSAEDLVAVVMEQLKARGLMYVDSGVTGSFGSREAYKLDVPWAAVEINLDEAQSRGELDAQLEAFAQLAQKRAMSVARVSATPLTMMKLNAWLAALDQKGFQLVPVSALAKKQLIR